MNNLELTKRESALLWSLLWDLTHQYKTKIIIDYRKYDRDTLGALYNKVDIYDLLNK